MKVYTPTGRVVPPPEFQRLPPHTEVGREVLAAVHGKAQAAMPTTLVNADYGALELRIAQIMANPEDESHG